jgi:hypothetical protein
MDKSKKFTLHVISDWATVVAFIHIQFVLLLMKQEMSSLPDCNTVAKSERADESTHLEHP